MKRKIYKLLSNTKKLLFVVLLSTFSGVICSQTTFTFNFTGSVQTLTLPIGVWGIQCWGANGGSITSAGGSGIGGYSFGQLTVTSPGTLLNIFVGGQGNPATGTSAVAGAGGWNGGGGGAAVGRSGAGGGGATDVRLTGTAAANRIIVAGGGGGAAYYGSTLITSSVAAGGNGGAQIAQNGNIISSAGLITAGGGGAGANGATPGTAGVGTANGTATGGGGGGSSAGSSIGQPGVGGGAGGAAGPSSSGATGSAGGGGGGFAGGAGGVQTVNAGVAGGGGSGFVGGVTSGTTVMSGQTGFTANPATTGNGRVIITQLCNINLTNASTTGPGPICAGNSATITTNAISNYIWSNGSTSSSIVVSPTVTTSYTLTATSPSNCTASSVITVIVQNGNPTVTAITSNTAVCEGQSMILSGAGANTYSWTSGVTNAIPYTPTVTSGYTVTGTNACGTGTAAVNVTVNPAPTVFGGVTSPTICSGSPVTFTSAGNATSYSWSNGVIDNVPFFPTATNNFTVTGTALGCSSVAVVALTVIITPTITPIASPNAMCFGQTATLSAVGATGYTWTPGSNPSVATITVSPAASTTYSLFRTNGLCSSTSTLNLTIFALPLVNASATPSQICAGTGINLLALGSITYTWLPGGFTIANFTIFPNFSTTYTVIGSNGNCTTSVAVPIVVNPSPVISISTPTTFICQGQSATLTANGSGALTYTWQPTGSNNSSIVVTPLVNTVYTLSATNASNCTTSANQVIIANALPNATISSSPAFVCSGETAVLSVSPSPNVTYNWSTGASGAFTSVSPTISTNYFVTGINNGNGCVNTGTIALSVFISTFVVSSPTAICKGATASLIATGPATSYAWITSNGVPVGSGVSSVTVSPASSTIYSVTGTNGSCSNTQSINLIVNPIPNVIAQTAKSTICRFEVSTISGSGATSYSWSTGATTPSISLTLSLTTSYTLTGTDVNGCVKTVSVTQFVATCIGIEKNSQDNLGVNVYPNPNNGSFVISSDVKLNLHLINALGQEMTTINLIEGDKKDITVSSLPAGIYFITGQSGDVKINKKVVIER